MNLHFVQTNSSFISATKECRSAFIEAMLDCSYGASETLDAWNWFYVGWKACEDQEAAPQMPL